MYIGFCGDPRHADDAGSSRLSLPGILSKGLMILSSGAPLAGAALPPMGRETVASAASPKIPKMPREAAPGPLRPV